MTDSAQPSRLQWISSLRVLALFAVIVLHTASPLLFLFRKSPMVDWFTADAYNALVRFAVPVFVMVTGALLLNKEYTIGVFFKKRLSRVLWPFLFWTLIYLGYNWYNGDIDFDDNTQKGIMQILHMLKYGAFYHLWYVYMLLGLYLVIPILNRFVKGASETDILYFILVWLGVMLIQQVYLVRFKPQIELRYFEGYIGYLVLGYHLSVKDLAFAKSKTSMAVGFVVIAALITIATYYCSNYYHAISTIPYEPVSPPIVALTCAVFLLFKGSLLQNKRIVAIWNFVDRYGYGIYLGHALVLVLLERFGVSYRMCTPVISIPATALLCMLITTFIVFVINRLPFGRYISG